MLMTGFLQPIPSCQPVVPAAVEAAAAAQLDTSSSPSPPQVISFYKPWDPYGALSNFSPHPISLPDESGAVVQWASVEHYYQVNDHLKILENTSQLVIRYVLKRFRV